MPKRLHARAAQDEREERQVRKLAASHHAPADWKFHAKTGSRKLGRQDASRDCGDALLSSKSRAHPASPASMQRGPTVWRCEKERDASPA